jgi:hypothetical protein
MPVIINEVEVFESAHVTADAAPSPDRQVAEPAHEQLRRLMRDLQERRRRLVAN